MSTQEAIGLRFPNQPTEFVFSAATPQVGDTLRRNGDEWQVIAVEQDSTGKTVVTLAPPGDGKAKPAS